MVCGMAGQKRRRPGRPRGDDQDDLRAVILDSAVEEFGARGYEGTSVRGVARRAGVDSSLVHHYFNDKAGLFAAALHAPDAAPVDLDEVLSGPRETVAERFLRTALERYEDRARREQMTALVRTAIGGGPMAEMTKAFLIGEVNTRFAAIAEGPDPVLRAELVSTQLLGLFAVRYVLANEPLASAGIDEIVAWMAPTIHRYLFD